MFAAPFLYPDRSDHSLDFSSVIIDTIRTYGQAPVAFVCMALVAVVPNILHLASGDQTTSRFSLFFLSFSTGQVVVAACAQAIMATLAARLLVGASGSVRNAIAEGLPRALPNVGTSILSMLLIGMFYLMLIIPGIYASVVLAVVTPVCVLERLGPLRSLYRGADLTDGYRWRVLGLSLTVTAVSQLLSVYAEHGIGLPVAASSWAIQGVEIFYMPVEIIFAVRLYLALLQKEYVRATALQQLDLFAPSRPALCR